MSAEHQKEIAKLIDDPYGITGHIVGISRLFEDVNMGIILSQLLYWYEKGRRPDGYISKTVNEFELETGLSSTKQRTALTKLARLQIVEVKKCGVPAKRCIRLNYQLLRFLITSCKENKQQPDPEAINKYQEKSLTITKTTHKNTSKKNNIDYPKRPTGVGDARVSSSTSISENWFEEFQDMNKRRINQ